MLIVQSSMKQGLYEKGKGVAFIESTQHISTTKYDTFVVLIIVQIQLVIFCPTLKNVRIRYRIRTYKYV